MAMMMICVAACQMVRSTGMRLPATACSVETGPGPVRCSSTHDTAPITPAAARVRNRRHHGTVSRAVTRCPSEMLQTKCSTVCSRCAQAHPVTPAVIPARTTAAAKRRSPEAPAVVCDVVVLCCRDGSELTFSYSRTPFPPSRTRPNSRCPGESARRRSTDSPPGNPMSAGWRRPRTSRGRRSGTGRV